jgi:charged multivesicular body protein 6
MLAGKISNADEDEVESELEALEREMNGPGREDLAEGLPEAPTDELERRETQKERWQRRQREQERQRVEDREALLA